MGRWDDEDDGPRFARSGRLRRFVKMGGLAASVAGSAVARRLGKSFGTEEQRQEAFRDSLVHNAERVVRTMGEMKGAAMKVGQMLSVAPEALPREFLEQLKSLQQDSPPMPFAMVSDEIEQALSRPLVDVFHYFEPEPVGAASIGQVHRARLFDGREVAVKVQYPGIADTLDSDLDNLRSLLSVGRVVGGKDVLDGFHAEIKEGLLDEANYATEARNLSEFGAILEKHPQVVVPKVIEEFSNDRVLTMEYLDGVKLDVALDAMDTEERNATGMLFSELFVWMFHEEHVLHADPHPGNFLIMPDGRIGVLDFGCMRRYDPEFTDGWIDILVAKWNREPHRLPSIFERLGYAGMGNATPATAEQLDELCDIILQPFLYDGPFNWGQWHPERELERFVRGNLNLIRYAAPPRAVFYFRVAAGVWGLLQRSQIAGNWYRVGREMAEKRGRL